MKFDELDAKMRVYETAHDLCVLPGIYMVARLDGRSFTRLTKEVHKFEVPHDERFRDYMVETVEHLMNIGLYVIYGYTQSDEISLLFDLEESAFNRKLRKLNSVLAGEASAKFSLLVGSIACFDCRISQLPNLEDVVVYFDWRHKDACRNAINSHAYWCLRREGKNARQASKLLNGTCFADKNELLFQRGINFNNVPNWQKRGVGLYWQEYNKMGFNPLTEEKIPTTSKRIQRDMELPMKDEYAQFIRNLVLRI